MKTVIEYPVKSPGAYMEVIIKEQGLRYYTIRTVYWQDVLVKTMISNGEYLHEIPPKNWFFT